MALKALIFDVDGTLADTERDGHRVAFNLAFQEAGLDWVWDEELYGQLLTVTGGKERISRFVADTCPEMAAEADFERTVRRLHESKTRHYLALLAQGSIPLRPGVHRLLKEAHAAGLRLAIATTTTPANVTTLLEHTAPELLEWFEVIGAGDVVAAKKPAPDIYFYVLEKLSLEPETCLAFEDSANGIQSARAAGLDTIITVNRYTRHEDFSGAVTVLDTLGEPESPFTILAGANPNRGQYLDIGMLQQLKSHTPL